MDADLRCEAPKVGEEGKTICSGNSMKRKDCATWQDQIWNKGGLEPGLQGVI